MRAAVEETENLDSRSMIENRLTERGAVVESKHAATSAKDELDALKAELLLLESMRSSGQIDLSADVLRPVVPDGPIPLSFAQQRLWFIDQWEPGNPFYNMLSLARLTGHLNLAAL